MKNSKETQDGGDEWELVSEDGTGEITDSNIHDSTADRDDASAMAHTLNQGDRQGIVEGDLTMITKDDASTKDDSSEIHGENGVDSNEKTKSDSDACLDTNDTGEKQTAGINSSEDEAYDMVTKGNENEENLIKNPDANPVDAKITSTLELENSEPQSEDEKTEDDLLESPDAKVRQPDDEIASLHATIEHTEDICDDDNENEDNLIENPDSIPVDAKITSTLERENPEPQSEDEKTEDDGLLESPDAKVTQSDDERSSLHSTIGHTEDVCDADNYETELSENLNTIGQSFRRLSKTVEEETVLVAKSVKKVFLAESKVIGRDIQKKAHKISDAVHEACVKHDVKGKAKKAEDVAKAAAKKIDDALKSVGEKAKSFNDEHSVLETLTVASLIGAGFFLTRGHAPTGAMLLATGGAIYLAGESMKAPESLNGNHLNKQKI